MAAWAQAPAQIDTGGAEQGRLKGSVDDAAPASLAGKPPPLDATPTPVTPSLAGKPPPLPPEPAGAVAPAPPSTGTPRPSRGSRGTGFVVAPGRALTNAHVVRSCALLTLRTGGTGPVVPARVVAEDRVVDVALLAVDASLGPPLPFRAGPPLRRGDDVVTYGFPLSGLLSAGPTLTTGSVSALSGLRDDPKQFQISAPVQPGNSGGPLLDRGGHVVGVVVAKLNAGRVAQQVGDIPQNVNFAIKLGPVLDFLRAEGVPLLTQETVAPPLSAAEVGDRADPSTVLIRCQR